MCKKQSYKSIVKNLQSRYGSTHTPGGIVIEHIAQLKIQNTFETHLDIARTMAKTMRADMREYDADPSKFTQSLGCWSGFHAQQMIKSVKRMKGTSKGTYVYLSGWMVAGVGYSHKAY